MDTFAKKIGIEKYSNPKVVQKKAEELGLDIYYSTRKDKKFMVMNPNNKWVHFGQMGYQDFTRHGDVDRLRKFKQRNSKWYESEPYTASYLSAWILW